MHRWVAGIVGLKLESIIEPADAGIVGPSSQRVKGTYMRAALWHYATGVRGSVILSHYSQ